MIDLSPYRSVAVRAWTEPRAGRRTQRRLARVSPPVRHILVFDTETTIDSAQALLFGAFRYARVDGATVTTVAEGLIYADDLPDTNPAGYATLVAYAASRKADVDLTYLGVEPLWQLQLISRAEFVARWLWRVGYPHNNRTDPATIVTFNAPFDFSRIAVDVSEARADLYGGFSFTVWTDKDGNPAPWRPRLAIKSLDSKRAIKKYRRLERGAHNFAGHLLDLRTLVFALTGQSHSLASACVAFGVPGKAPAPEFGTITEEAIDYCRQDVAATTGLYQAAAAEYATHPIDLQPTTAYSPASIAKAYLRRMGIRPRLTTQPHFPPEILGYAMSAFYGGRAEVHLRHVPAPVAVVDFTSMYPTVDTLMGIWSLVTATRVDTIDATAEVTDLLASITAEECFDPGLWPGLVAIAEINPDGDVVPVRANYRDEDWSIGVNHLDPLSPHQDRRDINGNRIWIDDTWRWILKAHTNPDTPLPDWANRPAPSRVTVSSPSLWRPFNDWNRGRPWADQIKPFNFLLVATLDPFGYPPGADPTKFRLIAPYNDNPDTWNTLNWRNRYDPNGPTYRITTDRNAPPDPYFALVKSYADILHYYRVHPEHKFNGTDQQPCRRNTEGVLQHRTIHLTGEPRLIGKEANNMDDVQAGLYAQLGDVVTEFDPTNHLFHQLVMPVLSNHSGRELSRLVSCDRRTIDRIRRGEHPRADLYRALEMLALSTARQHLGDVDGEPRGAIDVRSKMACLAYLAAWRATHKREDPA